MKSLPPIWVSEVTVQCPCLTLHGDQRKGIQAGVLELTFDILQVSMQSTCMQSGHANWQNMIATYSFLEEGGLVDLTGRFHKN